MKAVQISEFGDSSVLKTVKVKRPVPNDDEVLVKVKACSVNPIDYKVRKGLSRVRKYINLPKTSGSDFAGVVEKTGKNVKLYKKGDKVYGMVWFGGHGSNAEYLVAKESNVYTMPDLSFEEAASIPLAGLTALQSLARESVVDKGMDVLIIGASGGVGHFAVQIAKSVGARVTGVSSKKHERFVKGLGADKFIAYDKSELKLKESFDIIFDCSGQYNYAYFLDNLNKGGKFITTLPQKNFLARIKGFLTGRHFKKILVKPDHMGLAILNDVIQENLLIPHVHKVFKLKDIAKAHDYVEKKSYPGKIAVRI